MLILIAVPRAVEGTVAMRIEYDAHRDLLYLWFGAADTKAARRVTVSPGVHADFDGRDKLIGIEVLDASETFGRQVQFKVTLPGAAPAELAKG